MNISPLSQVSVDQDQAAQSKLGADAASPFICYALALISVPAAIVAGLFGDKLGLDGSRTYIVAGCIGQGVLWWVLGDVVTLLNRIARR